MTKVSSVDPDLDNVGIAKKLLQDGQADKAEAHLLGTMQTDTEDAETLYVLAVAQRYQSANVRALGTLSRLKKIRPNFGREAQERAYNFRDQGLSTDMLHALEEAVSLNPALLSSWRLLEAIYSSNNNQEAKRKASAQVAHLSGLAPKLLSAANLCLLYTSPSPRDRQKSRMPSSA